MIALKNRFFFLLAATTAMTILLSTSNAAFAQRDAGAQARAEFGAGFLDTGKVPVTHCVLRGSDHRVTPTTNQESHGPTSWGVNTSAPFVAKSNRHGCPPSGVRVGVAKVPKKAPWQYPKSDPRRYRL